MFQVIDLTPFEMRIEAKGEVTIEGYSAHLAASLSPLVMREQDPIQEAYGKLFGGTSVMSADAARELVAVCFATQPPPEDQNIDGPFIFMPGFAVPKGAAPTEGMSSVTIPAHLYMVLSFRGSPGQVGNMRYTLTEEFWPKTAPILGLYRDLLAPNIMIQPSNTDPEAEVQLFEMWTPIQPVGINRATD